jgi:hypothetical protein
MNLKRLAAAALAASALSGTIAACSASQPVTYAPAAYGVNGQCYYVNSPAEAVALEDAGLCPRSWVPALMPSAWHEEYYGYYDSPAYYTHYVPVRQRAVYVTAQRSYGTRYRSAISSLASRAKYRGSDGSTATGTKVAKARFGSGTSFGTTGRRYGGGSARTSGGSSRTGASSRTGSPSGGGSARRRSH